MPPFARPTFFISDLHLSAARPNINLMFARFMVDVAPAAERLYILGDLFDYWVGDDQLDCDPLAVVVAAHLRQLADTGTLVYLMHGNRDFLLGERFARAANLEIVIDPLSISLGNTAALLMHGDTLCTDDVNYQKFRAKVRSPAWQQATLAKPIADRLALAASIRSQSDVEKSMKAEAIMDVNADAVLRAFDEHAVSVMVHGHTHRPMRHEVLVAGSRAVRWVLQDWHEVGGYLSFESGEWVARVLQG